MILLNKCFFFVNSTYTQRCFYFKTSVDIDYPLLFNDTWDLGRRSKLIYDLSTQSPYNEPLSFEEVY